MSGYVELRRRADGLYHQRDHIGALLLYRQLLEVHPHDHAIRLHVGDSLSQLGLSRRAAQVYAAVALGHLRAGRPLQGVAACCALLSVAPSAGSVIPTLAHMYGRGADRVDPRALPPAPPSPPTGDLGPDPTPAPAAELLHSVIAIASSIEETEEPDRLPPLPILSDLEQHDLHNVLRHVRRRRIRSGEPLMRQGDPGDSFFMLAHGGVRVTRTEDGETRVLATLGPGAILGEMALVTRAPRSATVTALGDVDSIEIPVAALARVAGDSQAVAMALDRFTRDRLLRNALSASALFEPFWPEHAREVLPLFEPHEYAEGDRLLVQGEAGRGAYLLLSGSCALTRRPAGGEGDDGTDEEPPNEGGDEGASDLPNGDAGAAGPGKLLGETCLLGEGLATATVTATQPGLALLMERAAFDLLLEAHPEVRSEVDELDVDVDVVNAFATEELEFPPEHALPSDSEADPEGDQEVL